MTTKPKPKIRFKTRYNVDEVPRNLMVGLIPQRNYNVTPDVGLSTISQARRAQKEGRFNESGALTWRERPAPTPEPPAPVPSSPEPPAPSPPPVTDPQPGGA